MSIKKAFITGVNGQTGSYLAEILLCKGYEVHGLIRRSSVFTTERIQDVIENNPNFHFYYGDMTDFVSLARLIKEIKPDELYNLAAQSHVKVSFEVPEYTANADAIGALRLLETVREHCPECKVYQASTSEMFGGQYEEMPEGGYTEESPFHPRSPYGVAKLYAYWIMKNYREAYGLKTYNGILFNHESPRRGETFVTRKITRWMGRYVVATENGYGFPPLVLGNMDAHRDWGHARDYAEAQWMIMQHETPDDFVVATGKTYSVRDFVNKCFSKMGKRIEWEGHGVNEKGLCDGKVVVEISEKYFRPSEVDYLLGNPAKAIRELGWKPDDSFDDLVEDMLQHDIKLAREEGNE